MIFDMYASGSGYNQIIDVLSEKGYKTKRGQPFGKNSLYGILKNEKYKGTYVFNRAASKVGGKRNHHKSKDKSEIIWIPGGMPAIVSEEQWNIVAEKMNKNKHRQAAYTARATYLLSGLIYCGDCSGTMVGKKFRGGRNKTMYGYYECGNRKRTRTCSMKSINKDFIEKLVVDTLYENIFSPKAIQLAAGKIYKYARKQQQEIPGYLKEAKKELAQVDREIANIVNAITAGMFHESMKTKMDELECKKNALSLRLEEAQRQQQVVSISKKDIQTFLSQYSDIREMSKKEQKNAINLFVSKITVYEDFIDINISPFITSPPKPDGEDDSGGKKAKKSSLMGVILIALFRTGVKPDRGALV